MVGTLDGSTVYRVYGWGWGGRELAQQRAYVGNGKDRKGTMATRSRNDPEMSPVVIDDVTLSEWRWGWVLTD